MSSTHPSPPRVRLARRSAIIGAAVAASLVGWAVPAAAQPTAAFPAQVTPTPVAFDLYAVSGTTNLPGLPSVAGVGVQQRRHAASPSRAVRRSSSTRATR